MLQVKDLIQIIMVLKEVAGPIKNRRPTVGMLLDVGDGHVLYYEVHGPSRREAKRTAVVLHGGPGGGLQRKQLRHFDLTKWRVVLFDQRGCGKSTPLYSIQKNTTWDLVADIEKLREAVGVDQWTVFGGSWGSTLALAYAAKHLNHVDALVVRGIYLGEARENDWLYKEGGASSLYPEEWARFAAGAAASKSNAEAAAVATARKSTSDGARTKSKKNLTATYRRLLQSKDRKTRRRAAAAWWGWESAISFLVPKPDDSKASEVESLAILENHYFSHTCWLKPGQLLAAARRIPASVPVHIVQGRYDLVCPPASAFALAQAVPHAHLTFTLAGHAGSEKPTAAALRKATDSLLK